MDSGQHPTTLSSDRAHNEARQYFDASFFKPYASLIPDEPAFYALLAQGLDRLSPRQHRDLLITFIHIGSVTETDGWKTCTVHSDNYEALHQTLANLIQEQLLTVNAISLSLKLLVTADTEKSSALQALLQRCRNNRPSPYHIAYKPVPEATAFARSYFSDDWLKSYAHMTREALPENFHQVVAWSVEQLSGRAHRNLLITCAEIIEGQLSDRLPLPNVAYTDFSVLQKSMATLIHKRIFLPENVWNILNRNITYEEILALPSAHSRVVATHEDVIDVLTIATNVVIPQYAAPEDYIEEQDVDYEGNRLGTLLQAQLALTDIESGWLNKFRYEPNVFLEIDACRLAVSKLYLAVLHQWSDLLALEQKTVEDQTGPYIDEWVRARLEPQNGYYNQEKYLKEEAEACVFQAIFKKTENTLRAYHGHKRKVSDDLVMADDTLATLFDHKIGTEIARLAQALCTTLPLLDEEAEIQLNIRNVNRWKERFDVLIEEFTVAGKTAFITGIHTLERQNQGNPAIEHIFFEASKFIAGYDRIAALRFYIYYLYYDLHSAVIDNKQLTKTIQKSLFQTNEHLHDFEKIVAQLVSTENLKAALEAVEKIYHPKRRKIEIDTSRVQAVQQRDHATANRLGEYLKDEYQDEHVSIRAEEVHQEEVIPEILPKPEVTAVPRYIEELNFNELQHMVLDRFVLGTLSVTITELDEYCTTHKLLRSQVIESINDLCYDVLDDVLIEENETDFTISEPYFFKITRS